MLADDQRKNSGVGATVMLPLSGIDITGVARQERVQLVELFARGRDQRAGRGMFLLGLAPRRDRIAAVQAAGQLAELFLRRGQLARRDRQQAIDRQRDAFFEAQLLLEAIAPEAERALGLRPNVGLEIGDVGADRLHRFAARIGEIAEQVHVVDVGEGARQIGVDERHRAAPGVDADLDEDRRRFLDVVARRLHEPRHLPQLRQDAAGALGLGRVGEDRLRRQARRQRVGVDVRVALPRPDRFELELPGADIRRDDLVLDLLAAWGGRRQECCRAAGRSPPAR